MSPTVAFETIWQRIEAFAGQEFRQKRGGEFTYVIESGCVSPNRTNRMLPRSQFEQAWERMPPDGPGALQDLQGPSYLWAILIDPRISG